MIEYIAQEFARYIERRNESKDPYIIVGNGIGDWSGALRMKKGQTYQVVHFSNGSIRYRYGSLTSPELYAPLTGVSQILVCPGEDIFIELSQAQGDPAYFHVIDSF